MLLERPHLGYIYVGTGHWLQQENGDGEKPILQI